MLTRIVFVGSIGMSRRFCMRSVRAATVPGRWRPFRLLTYSDAAKRAALIATVTGSRIMPPWKPDPGPVPFLNEGRLSDPQVVTLRKWAEAGAPEGDAILSRSAKRQCP